MSMRIFSASLTALALAACGGADDADPLSDQGTYQADNGMIECAAQGAAEFERRCSVERTQSDEGLILTLRHDSGSFRRLLVTSDGRGVIAADGAEPAIVNPVSEGLIEVSVGDDRYRLPATVQ